VDLLQPVAIVAIHSITRGRQCNNFDGPAEELARRMADKNGYPVRKSIGYPTPGSFGSWAGLDRQIPTITLELPHDQDGESAWSDNRDALLEFVRAGDDS
jgi:protein MpaA